MALAIRTESDRTAAALRRMTADVLDEAQRQGLMQAALVVERAAKQKLTESGRHAPGTPTPSAPGSPPAIISGTLRASVKTTKPIREGFGNYQIMVGPTVVYGRVQELGGGPYNLPARPYMQPAMEQSIDDVRNAYANVIRKYANG